ncbi:TonB-dependent receptor domain-containing protein [Sphingosinicella rhizophila]|uniref:TonB-dependent receptor n=1 Tax=Sphingosinicella rhizophila TaxID=3050082 RepID=A0ABU3Q6Z1_9SPHN|nr:TonB-dependent receptor [Sphingosinicella sp. GR2756]MDT9598879.1 TonB-dependent receptor [Sphingosinicella sp. GR2756]
MGIRNKYRSNLILNASLAAIGTSLFAVAPAMAQTTPDGDTPAEEAGVGETDDENVIVVTGSRIERAGFDQPTPTTVVGGTEIRQAAAPNLQQVLNDQPQVRPSVLPATTVGNTGSGTAPVDLRGLGTNRTLVLLNGRRFVGEGNLNVVPLSLVQRLDLVTGGASAAYGSGAVAGVVNIILDTKLEGIRLGAETGISSRGDGERYRLDGAFGTSFADGNGHFMIGAEYVDDKGISPHGRKSRPGLRGGGQTVLNGQVVIADDVNAVRSESGLIRSGIFAGQTFNNDGTLRPYRGPGVGNIGGEDASNLYDHIYLAGPFERLNVYGRVSYDIGGATIWADANYGRVRSSYDFFPDYITPGDFGAGPITVSAANPFLPQSLRDQLAAAGETSFLYSRTFTDIFMLKFESEREYKEGAIGIDGTFGNGWKYSAHYSHGELETTQALNDNRVRANYLNAINAVSSGGQIVCAINADANPANDDPACRPLNIFGSGNASAEAIDYVTADQGASAIAKLDAMGAEVQGDLFSLWAGPITVAFGVEARWESSRGFRTAEQIATAPTLGIPLYTSDVAGKFNVKEGFVELVVPVIDAEGIKIDTNGSARYSDYSTSGGIWSWKLGGTARLFNDLRLRIVRSRDIRSPSINELFSIRAVNIGPQVDLDTAGRTGIPGYNPNPAQVTTYSGGNPDLVPETSKTLSFGGSYQPSFIPGLSLSVDYYDIKISGAITVISASNLTAACAGGSQAACDRITRDPVTQTLTEVLTNQQNIASFSTSGLDFEAAYQLQVRQLMGDKPGSIRFRALATYVKDYVFDTGFYATGRTGPVNLAGDVGDGVTGLPKWRGTFSATYQDGTFGLDARVRYVGGGVFNELLDGTGGRVNLSNNKISARTYFDLGAQFKVMDRFTFFGNVRNLFDEAPPINTTASAHYDAIGRYFTFGAKVNF